MRRLILLMMVLAALGGFRLAAEPEPNVWNEEFAESLDCAKAMGMPIVVVWGNLSCSYCNKLLAAIEDSELLENWLAGHEVFLVRKHEAYGSKNEDYLAAKAWLLELDPQIKSTGFPYVGIYQQTADGVVLVSTAFTGRDGKMPVTESAGDLEGQFVGTLASFFGGIEPEEKSPLTVTTSTIAPLSQVEYRDIQLAATNADGVCRWRLEERGYDALSVTNVENRLADATGFVPVDGESEVDLGFDFPVNGRALRNVFVGTVAEPRLFINGPDGLRVDIRPVIADFGMSGAFSSVAVKQGGSYAVFRWQGDSESVFVLLDATGAVRYSYAGYESAPAAQLSVLDGTEWTWSALAGEAAATDHLLSPRGLSQIPAGLELSGDGAVLGLPTEAGSGAFRVCVEDAAGNVAVREIAYAAQAEKLTPDEPDEVEASDRTFVDKVVLSWTGDETAQVYEIYRSETGSLEDAEFLDMTTELSYADTTGEAEVEYCYFIRGVNGEFAGEFATVWGKRAAKLVIATEILPQPAAGEIYDEQMDGEGGAGVLRWEVVPNGYDVSNAVPDRAWRSISFVETEADAEYALPFAFPINGSKASSVFVKSEAELFFNCADGVRASLRPFIAPLGRSVGWSNVAVRAYDDRVLFRWMAEDEEFYNFAVVAEIFADGRIRYSYGEDCADASAAGYLQELSTLKDVEWAWRTDVADFTCDRIFTPQKYGSLPEGLELSGDGNLLGVPATNAADAIVCIRVTDGLGGSTTRPYDIEVTGVIPSPAKAVGCEDFDFSSEETPWFVEEGSAFEGKFALRSGKVGNSGKSIVRTAVTGSGLLTFTWKTSSLATDKTTFLIDGISVTNVTGNSEWTTVTVRVTGNREHTLAWQFVCGKKSATTDGCAWLDAVRWESRALTLAAALGQPDWTWTTTGDADWLPDEDDDGNLYGRSGDVDDDCSSEVSTTISGAGTLSFRWRASCEADCDWLVFYTNGEFVAEISDSTGWQTQTFVFGEGDHVLTWVYEKDENGFDYDDCGYLADVKWTSASADPTIEVNGHSLTVPAEWITNNFPEVTNMGTEAEKKLKSTAANGKNSVWECYVAGIDPTAELGEENSEFTATVEMVDGKPVVSWEPDLNDGGTKNLRTYTVKGAVEIGGPWVTVPAGQEANYNFFTVTVDLP